ncbi:MAG: DUF485 domain-containing protein [Planctomycetaceae bacterium]|jgi:uncharacterized membrane protein (DUF485 family)
MSNRNARTGIWLFLLYLMLYGSFVTVSAFFPDAMESTPVGDLNLAISWGFALIISAILLSFLYGILCRDSADSSSTPEGHGR